MAIGLHHRHEEGNPLQDQPNPTDVMSVDDNYHRRDNDLKYQQCGDQGNVVNRTSGRAHTAGYKQLPFICLSPLAIILLVEAGSDQREYGVDGWLRNVAEWPLTSRQKSRIPTALMRSLKCEVTVAGGIQPCFYLLLGST